jgi:hypothetical protein
MNPALDGRKIEGQERRSCLSAQQGLYYSVLASTILSTGNVESKILADIFIFLSH